MSSQVIPDRTKGHWPPNEREAAISRNMAAVSVRQSGRRGTTASRGSNRYSVSVLYSMAVEQEAQIDDDLTLAQRELRELKSNISKQSKDNYLLERDVRLLDSRIALLIQNRIALDEHNDVSTHLDDHSEASNTHCDERKMEQFGKLFFVLQTEPKHIATLCQRIDLAKMDTFLQTVMFTLYGNQYESREEHLLLKVFQNVLTAQFKAAIESESPLRANTPLSRMMTTYTRRGPGQLYIKSVLSGLINDLIADNVDLQINPEKIRLADKDKDIIAPATDEVADDEMTEEEEEANKVKKEEEMQALIRERQDELIKTATRFLTAIIESLDRVPYGIRWICKQIRTLTKDKDPSKTDAEISSLIGGFFFLRFVNPVIVTPQAYFDRAPGPNSRTTLTLIAKLLQSLANKPSFLKETFMKNTTERFLSDNTGKSDEFLINLCDVPDFYDSLEMDQYLALSKKEIVISITPNEVYNTIDLLRRHMDELEPEKKGLRLLVDEVGDTPAQVPRKDNKPFDLQLLSSGEITIEDMTSDFINENNITEMDILYMQTKAMLVQIARSRTQPGNVESLSSLIETAAAAEDDKRLMHKGIKARGMLDELEEAGELDEAVMLEDIKKELAHLVDLNTKAREEFRSLETVYKTIKDHNDYLKDQLSTYKTYLHNARRTGRTHIEGPFKFSHNHLERDGVIGESNVPEDRRNNVTLEITSPSPGDYIITLLVKGRPEPIVHADLKLDDLLEQQKQKIQLLDLKYIKLDVSKTLHLLNKFFTKKHSFFL